MNWVEHARVNFYQKKSFILRAKHNTGRRRYFYARLFTFRVSTGPTWRKRTYSYFEITAFPDFFARERKNLFFPGYWCAAAGLYKFAIFRKKKKKKKARLNVEIVSWIDMFKSIELLYTSSSCCLFPFDLRFFNISSPERLRDVLNINRSHFW